MLSSIINNNSNNENNLENKNKNKNKNTQNNTNISKSFNEFTLLSYEITKNLDIKTKKNNGIYFTPQCIINECFIFLDDFYKKNNIHIKNILEPCCGSCEFINKLNEIFNNKNITGIENNYFIYSKIKDINFNNNTNNTNDITLINKSFFDYNEDKKFDLIIGNPPFYVILKNNIQKKYHKFFDGRPNIFILFIIESLKKLEENGILCFVLPKNFLNCIYYDKLRTYIFQNFNILNIINCSNNKYIDTQQETIILLIQNNNNIKNNSDFTLTKIKYKIMNSKCNITHLNNLLESSTNLFLLNFGVKVGNVTWNENKSILTDDNEKTLLIYNSNIKDNKLTINKFKNDVKKNYINKKGGDEMVLVINRGYGKGDYVFNYCIIDGSKEYLVENHLIIIYHKSISNKDKLQNLYEKLIKSFNDERTKEFINIYFGNNAINTNELLYILPIYFD
jgi:tRNA1(Val) A37 N6-methylase TrmN6